MKINKKALCISSAIIGLGAALGIGILIGVTISNSQKIANEELEINNAKRKAIIDKRYEVNSLVANEAEKYIKSNNFKKYYIWKPEYEIFLKMCYFAPENNVDINKPWYENYGPLWQKDYNGEWYSGKLLLSQTNNKIREYWKVKSDDTDFYQISWSIGVYELNYKEPSGVWNDSLVAVVPFLFTFPTGA